MNKDHQHVLVSTTSGSGLSIDQNPIGWRESSLPELESTCADFLPAPGHWTRGLSRLLLGSMVVAAGSLVFWPLSETVRAAGLVRPAGENTLIQSEMGGKVLTVHLSPNQTVKAGDILVRLDTTSLIDERDQLRSELSALERQEGQARNEQDSLATQVSALNTLTHSLTEESRRTAAQARASLRFDSSELSRYESLLHSGAVARSLVEEKEARRQVSEAEVLKAIQGISEQQARGLHELARLRQSVSQARTAADELSKQVSQRRTRLQLVERSLRSSTLRAPRAGSVVSTMLRHPGQVIRPGDVVAVLAPNDEQLMVNLKVPARDISQVRPGQRVTLKVSGCPVTEFGVLPALVRSISADLVPIGNSAQASSYQVLVQPQQRELLGRTDRCVVRQGMDVQGDIITRRTTVWSFLMTKLRVEEAPRS